METIGDLEIRRHGRSGPPVIVLHGGPGAPGSAEPLARGLAGAFTVVEPWQRGSGGDVPLSVARHVADLHEVVRSVRSGSPPALVGESWGAMLALAYAAEHPDEAGPLALVGCGTFDPQSRAVAARTREERIARHLAAHPEHASDLGLPLEDRIMKWHDVTDHYEPLPSAFPPAAAPLDLAAHRETWADMLRRQEAGLYPGAFSAIGSPVLMLHGSHDPHPGRMIRDGLRAHLARLEYRELDRCGHQPAIERHARDGFFALLSAWLAARCGG